MSKYGNHIKHMSDAVVFLNGNHGEGRFGWDGDEGMTPLEKVKELYEILKVNGVNYSKQVIVDEAPMGWRRLDSKVS